MRIEYTDGGDAGSMNVVSSPAAAGLGERREAVALDYRREVEQPEKPHTGHT